MSNPNAPFGLRPWARPTASLYGRGPHLFRSVRRRHRSLYRRSGQARRHSQIINGSPYADVAIAASGDVFVGVVVGVLPSTRDSLTYRAASTQRLVLVADDPDLSVRISAAQRRNAAHRQRHRPQRQHAGGRRLDRHRILRIGRGQHRPEATTNTLDLKIVGIVDRSGQRHRAPLWARHAARATSWFASTVTSTPTRSREYNRWPLSTPAIRRNSFGPA
jgi:hypothetical protein